MRRASLSRFALASSFPALVSLFAYAFAFALTPACGSSDPQPPAKPAAVLDSCGRPVRAPFEAVAGTAFGVVTDGAEPVSGAVVRVGDARAVTNGQGAFGLGDLPARYDALVYAPSVDPRTVFVFQGVGRRDPELAIALPPRPRTWSADVSSPARGGLGDAGAGSSVDVFSTGNLHMAAKSATRAADRDVVRVTWTGLYAGAADLNRVFFDLTPDGALEKYNGRVISFLRVENGRGYVVGEGVSGFSARSVPVKLATPPSFARTSAEVFLVMGVTSSEGLVERRASLAADDAVMVPELPGAALRVRATAHASNGARGVDTVGPFLATSGPVGLSIPEAPEMIAPADGATDVGVGTAFQVTVPADADACMLRGVRELVLRPEDPAGLRVVITTAGDEARVPDLAPLGLSLPRSARYAVDVTRWAAFRDMEDLARDVDRASGRRSVSAPRTFTTRP